MNEGQGSDVWAEPTRPLDPGDLSPNIELWYDFSDLDYKTKKAQDWLSGDNLINRAKPKTGTSATWMIIAGTSDSPVYSTFNGQENT